MVNVGISGITGKMGTKIAEVVSDGKIFNIVGGIARKQESDYKLFDSFDEMVMSSDVVIDFSSPVVTMKVIDACSKYEKPIVIGTTGFSAVDIEKIHEYAKNVPIFMSSNFSLGINILNEILKKYTKFFDMNQYDIEVLETHHRNKKDAPSGTAISLARSVADGYDKNLSDVMHNNTVTDPVKDSSKIGVAFRRGGGVCGEHTVSFMGDFEVVDFSHKALDRKVFAYGAVKAAEWLLNKPKGFYSMQDMLVNI